MLCVCKVTVWRYFLTYLPFLVRWSENGTFLWMWLWRKGSSSLGLAVNDGGPLVDGMRLCGSGFHYRKLSSEGLSERAELCSICDDGHINTSAFRHYLQWRPPTVWLVRTAASAHRPACRCCERHGQRHPVAADVLVDVCLQRTPTDEFLSEVVCWCKSSSSWQTCPVAFICEVWKQNNMHLITYLMSLLLSCISYSSSHNSQERLKLSSDLSHLQSKMKSELHCQCNILFSVNSELLMSVSTRLISVFISWDNDKYLLCDIIFIIIIWTTRVKFCHHLFILTSFKPV